MKLPAIEFSMLQQPIAAVFDLNSWPNSPADVSIAHRIPQGSLRPASAEPRDEPFGMIA